MKQPPPDPEQVERDWYADWSPWWWRPFWYVAGAVVLAAVCEKVWGVAFGG
jgi:hypothetical protein